MSAWIEIKTGNINQWVCTDKILLAQPHDDGSVIMLVGGHCLICSETTEALVKRIAGKGKMSAMPKPKSPKTPKSKSVDAEKEINTALVQLA